MNMKQHSPPPLAISADQKLKFMELNADLRELKSLDSSTDYERAKGTLPEWEWSELKEKIRLKFNEILKERNDILNLK